MPLGNLTDCEMELIRCARDGKDFDFEDWAEVQAIPEEEWDAVRVVDGDVIAILLRGDLYLSGTSPIRPHPRGVQAMGLVVPDGLDISYTTLVAPLMLVDCKISSIDADSARVAGDLQFDVCTIAGAVDLIDARIDGSLSMNGTTLGDPAAPRGLRADRLVVTGGVHMGTTEYQGSIRRFEAQGKDAVRLLGATIDGTLDMQGARLGGKDADRGLIADRVTVKGSVFLNNGPGGTRFEAKGKDAVRLLGATIDGTLDMQGARLGDKGAESGLSADGVTVKGSVFLNNGPGGARFEAEGKDAVRLLGATIDGTLAMQGARLGDKDADSGLNAGGLTVKGGVFLSNGPGGTRFDAQGKDAVRLLGATIGGTLAMQGARLGGEDANSGLAADRLTVKGSVFLNNGPGGTRFQAEGKNAVRLPGATIKGQLNLIGAVLRTQSGTWLQCQKLDVADALFLRSNGYEGDGGFVDFTDAEIGALNDQRDGWPDAENTLVLDGLSYQRLGDCNIDYRLEWLGQQLNSHLGKLRVDDKPRDVRPQPFEQCAKVLREMGHPRDAKRILVDKQKWLRRKWAAETGDAQWWKHWWRPEDYSTDPWGWRYVAAGQKPRWPLGKTGPFLQWLSYQFRRYVTNYGFSSMRPLVWFALFVVLGWLVYMDAGAEPGDIMVPAQSVVLVEEPYASSKQLPDGYPQFHALLYSLDVTLPLVELFQEPYWEPAGDKAPGRAGLLSGAIVRWFQIVQVLGGWVFISFFVAGLANAIRRDD